jgi:hypothetical protein
VADFRDPRTPMALSYTTVPLLWLGHEKMRGKTRETERDIFVLFEQEMYNVLSRI